MFAPKVLEKVDEALFDIKVEKDMDEKLHDASLHHETIDSMIWSHWHLGPPRGSRLVSKKRGTCSRLWVQGSVYA
jgi:hypothetical protein